MAGLSRHYTPSADDRTDDGTFGRDDVGCWGSTERKTGLRSPEFCRFREPFGVSRNPGVAMSPQVSDMPIGSFAKDTSQGKVKQ
jgi:hypothetical protein